MVDREFCANIWCSVSYGARPSFAVPQKDLSPEEAHESEYMKTTQGIEANDR